MHAVMEIMLSSTTSTHHPEPSRRSLSRQSALLRHVESVYTCGARPGQGSTDCVLCLGALQGQRLIAAAAATALARRAARAASVSPVRLKPEKPTIHVQAETCETRAAAAADAWPCEGHASLHACEPTCMQAYMHASLHASSLHACKPICTCHSRADWPWL